MGSPDSKTEGLYKMKRKRFFGGSIVFNWLATYLVLLLAMLSIVVIMSNYNIKTLENEIKTSNQHFVKAIGNDVDNAIGQAENIYEEIFFSQWFQTINTATQFDPNTRFSIYKLYDELRVKGATSPLVGMSMVYFPEIDTIVSDQASLTSEYYYKIFLSDSGIDYASYRMMLDNRYSNEYLLLPNGKGQGMICYATTYPVSSSFAGRANIVVLISPKKLSGLLDEYINYQISGIGIQSDSSQPMLLNAQNGSNDMLLKYLSEYKQDGMYRTDGGSMMISSVAAHVKGWRYISLSPANAFDRIQLIKKCHS